MLTSPACNMLASSSPLSPLFELYLYTGPPPRDSSGATPLMAACGRRDLEMSIPVVQLLLERGANAAHQASPSSLLGEGILCSRLGLSRDTPIKNAASQPALLRLLTDAGATMDAHIVVYAVEDWCDKIAGHLGEAWASETGLTEIERAVDFGDDDVAFTITPPCELGAARVAQKVADILSCEGGGDDDGGETKGDAATTNEADSTQLSLGTNPFTAFFSQIAAALQEVLDLGGDVNAPDKTGKKRDGMHSLDAVSKPNNRRGIGCCLFRQSPHL